MIQNSDAIWTYQCFMRFSEEDNPVAYAEPTGFPEALSVWTSPASMAGLEAAVERI
jgi:hypothetical protein